jgi:NTE family protein
MTSSPSAPVHDSDPERRLIPILAGGGTRLPAHVGVLAALEEMGYRLPALVGVSGGSIVAALHAAGRSVEELKELSLAVDFRQFRGFSLRQLLFHGGLSSGDGFEHWIDQQLAGLTFAQLPRDLHVVATDVRSGEPVLFDKATTPEVKVATAVRFSMGIPLLFAFKEYQGKLLVDGSILAEEALRQDWGHGAIPVCCFRLRGNPDGHWRQEKKSLLPLPDYLIMLIRSFMTTVSREFVNDSYWNSTIVIDTGNASPTDFNAAPQTKEELFQRGRQTTLEFLPVKLRRD